MADSTDLHAMLAEIINRLDRIEMTLNQKATMVSSGYSISEESNLSFSESEDYSDDQLDQELTEEAYVSDDDTPIVMEASYDSDHDRPFEAPDVYPESKILLTPLQIQLANEEFMQYKGHSDSDDDSE